jgi:hypothetical protein
MNNKFSFFNRLFTPPHHIKFLFMCLWGFLSFHALNAQPKCIGCIEPHNGPEPTRTWQECTSPDPSLNPCIQTSCDNTLRPPISTNPAAPSNVLRPDLANRFNWELNTYPLVSASLGSATISSFIHQAPDNGIMLERFGGLDRREIFAADGWEIITQNLGGINSRTGDPVNVPNLVLYNRYSGVLRVFIARGVAGYATSYARVRVSMIGTNASSALDIYSGESRLKALEEPYIAAIADNAMEVINTPMMWSYADFVMLYDPCTCFFSDNNMKIEIENVSASTISLEGTIFGDITHPTSPRGESLGGTNFEGVEFSRNYVKGFGHLYKFFDESKKIIDNTHVKDDLATKEAKTKAFSALQNVIDKSGFLKEGLKAMPYVSLALGIYDLFKGSSPASPMRLAPLALNAQVKLKGTITSPTTYSSFGFSTPGSNNSNTLDNARPTYNEILGTFNLLETPIVLDNIRYHGQHDVSQIGDVDFKTFEARLDKPIKYLLNPAAGIEIQDVSTALVAQEPNDFVFGRTYFIPTENITISSKGSKTYSSPIQYNMGESPIFKYDVQVPVGYLNVARPLQYFVQITVNYKRKDGIGNNFVETYRYPAKRREGYNEPNPTTPNMTWFIPAQRQEVNRFCNDPAYKNRRIAPLKDTLNAPLSLKRAMPKPTINIAPNPANQEVAVHYDLKTDGIIKSYIMDLTGRVVSEVFTSEVSKGNYSLTFPTQTLANGMYIVVFEQNGERSTHKLVISH